MSKQQDSGGLNLFTILGVVFIVLKLIGQITWSWWWVLSPFYIGFLFIFLAFFISGMVTHLKSKRRLMYLK